MVNTFKSGIFVLFFLLGANGIEASQTLEDQDYRNFNQLSQEMQSYLEQKNKSLYDENLRDFKVSQEATMERLYLALMQLGMSINSQFKQLYPNDLEVARFHENLNALFDRIERRDLLSGSDSDSGSDAEFGSDSESESDSDSEEISTAVADYFEGFLNELLDSSDSSQ